MLFVFLASHKPYIFLFYLIKTRQFLKFKILIKVIKFSCDSLKFYPIEVITLK